MELVKGLKWEEGVDRTLFEVGALAKLVGTGAAKTRHVSLSLFVLALLSISAVSQSSGPEPQSTGGATSARTVVRTSSRLVLIDAVVTDHSGNPVTDLKASDFELLDNGKAQQIRVFSYHHADNEKPRSANVEVEQSDSLATATAGSDVYSNVHATASTSEVPTIIVLDGLNTGFPEWTRASEDTVRYLKSVTHGLVAVFVLRRYLRVVQDFTDPSQAALALDRYNKDLAHPLSHQDDVKLVNGSADVSEESISSQKEITETEDKIDRSIGDSAVRITLEALEDAARAASGFRGRKNLIWISSGFPLYLREGSTGPMENYEELLHSATNALADAQVAVYPIDPRGLLEPAMTDFAFTGTEKSGRLLRGNAIGAAIEPRELAVLPVHEAMDQIAQSTGGRAAYRSNFLAAAISRASADGSSYYALGYYPTNVQWDGRFHEVRINIHRESHLDVRARSGYFAIGENADLDKKSRQDLDNELSRSLRIGAPEMRALPFLVRVTNLDNSGKLRIAYIIPPKAISFGVGAENKEEGDIEYGVRVYDARGKEISARAGTFKAQLNAEHISNKQFLVFTQDISLPAGSFLLKIGTIDLRGGFVGSLSLKKHIIYSASPKLEKRSNH